MKKATAVLMCLVLCVCGLCGCQSGKKAEETLNGYKSDLAALTDDKDYFMFFRVDGMDAFVLNSAERGQYWGVRDGESGEAQLYVLRDGGHIHPDAADLCTCDLQGQFEQMRSTAIDHSLRLIEQAEGYAYWERELFEEAEPIGHRGDTVFLTLADEDAAFHQTAGRQAMVSRGDGTAVSAQFAYGIDLARNVPDAEGALLILLEEPGELWWSDVNGIWAEDWPQTLP